MRFLGLDADFRPSLDDENSSRSCGGRRPDPGDPRPAAGGAAAVRDRVILIAAERWPDQVAELLAGQPELGPIRPHPLLCCNEPLVAVDAAVVAPAVPPLPCWRITGKALPLPVVRPDLLARHHRERMREMLRCLGLDPGPPSDGGGRVPTEIRIPPEPD